MTADASASVTPDISIFVDDVEAAHTSAVASGAQIVYSLSTEPLGVRRFFHRDSSGA